MSATLTQRQPVRRRRSRSLEDLVAAASEAVDREMSAREAPVAPVAGQDSRAELARIVAKQMPAQAVTFRPVKEAPKGPPLHRRLLAVVTAPATRLLGVPFLFLTALLWMVYAFSIPSIDSEERRLQKESADCLRPVMERYAAARGQVFSERETGGAHLYPRGFVLAGDPLYQFWDIEVGSTGKILLRPEDMAQLVRGFSGFQPVFAGGEYFRLPTKGWSPRLVFVRLIVRRDSETAGTVVRAVVGPRARLDD